MNRCISWLFPILLASVVWLSPPGSAWADNGAALAEPDDRLKKLEQDVEALKKQLPEIKSTLESMLKQLEDVDKLALQVQANAQTLRRLREDLTKMLADLNKLQAGGPGGQRRAFSIPDTGRVQLLNEWIAPATVVVDGLAYRLLPGEARMLTKPAGPFTYEVLNIQPMLARNVTPGEVFTIRIGPR